MNNEQGLQACPESSSLPTMDRPVVPILIQVPALPALMAPSPSPRPNLRVRPRTSLRPQKRRRRLRREVRAAAYATMLMAPLMFAPLGFRAGRTFSATGPEPALSAEAADLVSTRNPPVISISIEPAVGGACTEAEPPVVFPGYLLPDDDTEGTVHAGS
jgi:hypothetical protein